MEVQSFSLSGVCVANVRARCLPPWPSREWAARVSMEYLQLREKKNQIANSQLG